MIISKIFTVFLDFLMFSRDRKSKDCSHLRNATLAMQLVCFEIQCNAIGQFGNTGVLPFVLLAQAQAHFISVDCWVVR